MTVLRARAIEESATGLIAERLAGRAATQHLVLRSRLVQENPASGSAGLWSYLALYRQQAFCVVAAAGNGRQFRLCSGVSSYQGVPRRICLTSGE